MKKVLVGLFLLIVAFIGLRYYLIIKPIDYPVNRDDGCDHTTSS